MDLTFDVRGFGKGAKVQADHGAFEPTHGVGDLDRERRNFGHVSIVPARRNPSGALLHLAQTP
jgi:hypothetical protein